MSDLDLTEAVDAAARAVYERQYEGRSWDDAPPATKHAVREAVLPAVEAAAPVIEAAVRANAARAIEQEGTTESNYERRQGLWRAQALIQAPQ